MKYINQSLKTLAALSIIGVTVTPITALAYSANNSDAQLLAKQNSVNEEISILRGPVENKIEQLMHSWKTLPKSTDYYQPNYE